jgi:hypothetical protein
MIRLSGTIIAYENESDHNKVSEMKSVKKLMLSAMAGAALLMASNAQAAYIGTDAGYSGSQVAANFRSVSAAADVFIGDDDYTTFTLPFAFTFYGQNYAAGSVGWVSVNGLLGFDPLNAGDYCCNATYSNGAPTNTIFAGWFDLYGSVSTQTNGAAGNREFVFTWDGNEYDPDSDGAVNRFQAILHETSNDIEFQYDQLNDLLHYTSVGGIRGDELTNGLDFIDFAKNVRLGNVGLLITHSDAPTADVPEPGSVALLGLGLAALALTANRRARARTPRVVGE